jgi:hypothetical protein
VNVLKYDDREESRRTTDAQGHAGVSIPLAHEA